MNVPPNDADLGALDFPLGLVDVGHTLGIEKMDQKGRDGRGKNADLAKVELGLLFGSNTFYLDERGVWTRVALGTLVPKDAALAVESERCDKLVKYIWTSGVASIACKVNGWCFCGLL